MVKTISVILVPTDYTTCTGEAIGWAVSLAAPLSASLLLLHVIRREIADEMLSIPGMNWETLVRREKKALIELYRNWVSEEEGGGAAEGDGGHGWRSSGKDRHHGPGEAGRSYRHPDIRTQGTPSRRRRECQRAGRSDGRLSGDDDSGSLLR